MRQIWQTLLLAVLVFSVQAVPAYGAGERKISLTAIAGSDTVKLAREILVRAYHKIGYEADVVFLPGKRARSNAINGVSSGEVARVKAYGKKSPTLVRIATELFVVRGAAFAIKDEVELGTLDDLSKYRIGVLRGVLYSDRLTDGYNRHYAKTISQLFKMLVRDRVDLIIAIDLSGMMTINREYKDTPIRVIRDDLIVLPVFHYLHENKAELVPRIAEVILNMKKSGELGRIRKDFVLGEVSASDD